VPQQLHMDAWHSVPSQISAAFSTMRLRNVKGGSMQEPHFGQVAEQLIRGEVDADAKESEFEARDMAAHLIAKFQAGEQGQQEALYSFERLSFTNKCTSRAAQLALGDLSLTEAASLAEGLRGNARSAALSKHANHVIQKITQMLPASRTSFIVDEIKGHALEVAQNTFGCRVLCRIIEHSSAANTNTLELIEEMVDGVDGAMCNHPFGSFVVRCLLEHGLPDHKHRILKVLLDDPHTHSKDKFGSHVVEKALQDCSPEDQMLLALKLIAEPHELVNMASSEYGRHVAKALLTTSGDHQMTVLEVFRPMNDQLKVTRFGKSVMQSYRSVCRSLMKTP